MKKKPDSYNDFASHVLDELQDKEQIERQATDKSFHKLVNALGVADADKFAKLYKACKEAKDEDDLKKATEAFRNFTIIKLRERGRIKD